MRLDLGITRDKNVNLWPILKRSVTDEKRELQVLFPFYQKIKFPQIRKSSSYLFPLYWHQKDSANKDFRLLSTYYPSVFHYQSCASEQSKGFHLFEILPNVEAFAYKRSADGTIIDNNLLFFLWYKQNKRKQTLNIVTFPVYWYFNSPKRTSNTFFPFFSYGNYHYKNYKYFALTPLYWHSKHKYGRRNLLLPLYWNNQKFYNGDTSASTVIFPLFWNYRNPKRENTILFPVLWNFNNNYYSSTTFFPLFAQGHSSYNDNNHLVITPFFYHIKHSEGLDNVLFPLWWQHSRNGNYYSHTIFPIYWERRNNYYNNKIFFPFAYQIYQNNYYSFTAFPFFSKGSSDDGLRKHQIVTPLFYRFQNRNALFSTIFPVYWKHTADTGMAKRNALVFFPFYWEYRSFYKQSRIVFPVYWHFREDTGIMKRTQNILFPLYWQEKSPFKKSNVLFPVYWQYKNQNKQSLTIFPLFSHGSNSSGGRYCYIAPLYYQQKSPFYSQKVFFPLLWYEKKLYQNASEKSMTVFPFYWQTVKPSYSKLTIFPLYWYSSDKKYATHTLFPFYSYGRSVDLEKKHLTITPLFWQFKNRDFRYNVVFPVWWNKKYYGDSGEVFSSSLFLLYWHLKYKEKRNTVIFPALWYFSNAERKSLTLAPLFSYGKNTRDNSNYVILPLFARFKRPLQSTTTIFPLYWNIHRQGRAGSEKFIFSPPVFWRFVDSSRSNTIFAPLVWSFKKPQCHSFTVFPFYTSGKSCLNFKEYRAITPLYWHFRNGDNNQQVLFPLFWRFADDNKTNTIVFPLVWNFKSKFGSSFTLFPLYSSGNSFNGQKSYRAITPVFWQFKDGDKEQRVVFPLLWNTYKKHSAEHFEKSDVLFPLYWHYQSPAYNNEILFPLVWSFRNKFYNSFTIFPLFSGGRATNSSSRHTMAALVYWNFKNKDGVEEFLFPLYYRKTKMGSSDTSSLRMFLGLAWDFRDNNSSTQTFFPLIWNHNSYKRHDFVFFPLTAFGHSKVRKNTYYTFAFLFYRHKKANQCRNVLFPVFWNYSEKYDSYFKKRTVLFPVYFSKHNNYVNNKTLFPLLWCKNNNRINKKSFTFFPIFSWGRDSAHSINYHVITPLYWNVNTANYHSITLFPVFSRTIKNDETKAHLLFILYRYYRYQQYKNASLVWPLCQYKRDDTLKYFHVAPLLWYKKSPAKNYFSIQPFYYFSKSDTKNNLHILWQLFVHENEFQVQRSSYFLWKFYYSRKFHNSDFETRLLYLLYANVKEKGQREISVFPIFHTIKQADGTLSKSAAFYFYQRIKKPIPVTGAIYMEERIFWFLRLRSNYRYLEASGKLGNFKRRK